MFLVKHLHFIGIGGTGMSGIAEVMLNLGYIISGSDLSQTPVTERLQTLGARVFAGHDKKNIRGADVVVISSAVKEDNPEVVAAREIGIPVVPRAVMLADALAPWDCDCGCARENDDHLAHDFAPCCGWTRSHVCDWWQIK